MAHTNATEGAYEDSVAPINASFVLIPPPLPGSRSAPFHMHLMDAVNALDRTNFRHFKNNPLISDATKATATATRRRHRNKIYARACKEKKRNALLDAHNEITALKDQLREAHATIERLAQPWPRPRRRRNAGPPSPPSPPSPQPSTSATHPNAAARQPTQPQTPHS